MAVPIPRLCRARDGSALAERLRIAAITTTVRDGQRAFATLRQLPRLTLIAAMRKLLAAAPDDAKRRRPFVPQLPVPRATS